MTDAQWIEQWFPEYASRQIPRSEKERALAQLALYAVKDGAVDVGNDLEFQKSKRELMDFVRRHNERYSS